MVNEEEMVINFIKTWATCLVTTGIGAFLGWEPAILLVLIH